MEVMINWKVRMRNPVWWAQVLGAVLLTAMAHQHTQPTELTSWAAVWDLIKGTAENPYLVGLCAVSVWNAINDPTVAGMNDCAQTMTCSAPKSAVKHDDEKP